LYNPIILMEISKHVVAFGGDAMIAEPENKLSAQFVLGLARKPSAEHMRRICFLPTASGDSESYIQAFHARYDGLAEASHLNLFLRKEKDLRSFLLAQDVIYVGGGNTANMLAIWRVHSVDKILREAYDAGIVMCGTSAGSLCWFECGVTDSFGLDLAPLFDGLGFIKGSNCPHYDSEVLRQPQYHKFIAEGFPGGYAADDGAALHFINGEFNEAVSSKPAARAFEVKKQGNEVIEKQLMVRFLGD
jgi:dipeptidase E